MSEMPERIWAGDGSRMMGGHWSPEKGLTAVTEFIRADLVADLVKAAEAASKYLRDLEGNMLTNDADMMLDDCLPPSHHADALDAALARAKVGTP